MKPSLIDTDILSEFFRENEKVVDNADKYLQKYPSINFSIITYYEILNGLLYKDAKNQLKKFNAFVGGHSIDDRATIKLTDKNEQASQRFNKIKRGATPHNSRHTVAPHLLLPHRTKTDTP